MKRSFLFFVVAAVLCFAGERSTAQNIYTFAGIGGTNGYTGDDSVATTAELSAPSGIAWSSTGNVYFADSRNNVIRMVNPSGIITTVAGNGTAGYTGDGGAATLATFRGPNGVAVDASGNLYVADSRNNVIRRIDATGTITTVAGTGTPGYTGDGSAATTAELGNPFGVAVDGSGNLYISDTRNLVVRKVNTSGIINTIAGNNTPGYSGDSGPATAAQLDLPAGLAVTSSGTIYVADFRNYAVRVINTSGIINTYAGTGISGHSGDGGPATAAKLNGPYDVKVDASGNVFIADSSQNVRMVNPGGTISNYAGTGVPGYTGDGGPATAAEIFGPVGLAIDASHNVYISAQGSNVIRRVGTPIAGIYITSNTGDTTCVGSTTNFTATPVADLTPHYQWQQNGVNVGTDNIHYTPASLAKRDVIDCILLTAPGGSKLAISNNFTIDSLPAPGVIMGPASICKGGIANLRDISGRGTWASGNTAVATIAGPGRATGIGIGSAVIYYIQTNTCGADSASFSLTVAANTVGAVTGPKEVCAGQTATYTDTTAAGKWRTRPAPLGTIDSVTGVFTAGSVPGPIVIIYGTTPGCVRLDTITIDSLPVNAAITGAAVVDSGSVITLSNTNTGGVWSSSNTAIATVDTSGNVLGVSSGVVTISYTITSPAGCVADTTFNVTVVNTAGVLQHTLSGGISIFPNPSRGLVYISVISNSSNVVIADLSGRTVYSSTLSSGTNKLDISDLKAGIYMVTVLTEKGYYHTKLEITK